MKSELNCLHCITLLFLKDVTEENDDIKSIVTAIFSMIGHLHPLLDVHEKDIYCGVLVVFRLFVDSITVILGELLS